MVQKTHKHWSTRNVFPDSVFPFKYKYRITARFSTFDEKLAFDSLAMLDIQYLMSEWHNTGAILLSGLKHVLKQGMHENRGFLGQLEMGQAGYLFTCPRT